MDIDKMYAFAVDAASGYVHMLTTTVAASEQSPVIEAASAGSPVLVGQPSEAESRVPPHIFGYVAISALLGTALTTITHGGELKDTLRTVCWLSIVWLVYGSVAFGICKLFGGRGRYVDTIAMMYRILATAFVVGSVVSVAVLACARLAPALSSQLSAPSEFLEKHKFVPYYITHVVFLMVYMPLNLRRLHRLSIFGVLALLVYPVIAACLGLVIVLAFLGLHAISHGS